MRKHGVGLRADFFLGVTLHRQAGMVVVQEVQNRDLHCISGGLFFALLSDAELFRFSHRERFIGHCPDALRCCGQKHRFLEQTEDRQHLIVQPLADAALINRFDVFELKHGQM